MQEPFFSVLIPTKNRAHLVGHAISSVLAQSFIDFEVILSDNDDEEDTNEIVSKFDDARIRYFRTGGMSMPENWEFAREQARGLYVTVLEDKQAYYSWALECLYQLISKKDHMPVCIWNWDALDLESSKGFLTSDDFEEISSEFAIRKYVSGKIPWRISPRLLNSCAPRKCIDHIAGLLPDNKFFIKYSPDLCAAFAQLAVVDKVYYTTKSIGYMNGSESNASSYRVMKNKSLSYYSGNDEFEMSEAVSKVPIKNERIVFNTVYNDYLKIQDYIGGQLTGIHMTPYEYSRMCLGDVLITLRVRGSCKQELIDIFKYTKRNLSISQLIILWPWFICNWVVMPVIKTLRRLKLIAIRMYTKRRINSTS